MSLESNDIYEFEGFRLDLAEKVLLRDDVSISITPKVFETLQVFVENAGQLIEKDELMERIWHERFVEESNLTFNIKMLRKALGDNAQKPRFLETVPKRGYRFIAQVTRIEAAERRRSDGNGKNDLSIVSTSPLLPVSPSHPTVIALSQKSAVVALADWRHDADENQAEKSNGHTAKLELAPARPYVKSPLKYLALVAAGLVLGAIGLGYYFLYAAGGGETIDSVAVMPFVNVTGDANAEYLSEGISDSIINSLARLPNLKVNSLNSVLPYKGKDTDLQTVGSELNVRAILTGRMTLQGDDLAISVELVDVRDSRRLWGGQYTRKLSDIIVVQGEIARQISDSLRLRLSGDEKKLLTKQYTNNAEAYLLYNFGKYYGRQNTKEGFEKAIEFFEQAIKIDPNYALAYGTMAGTYHFMGTRGFAPTKETEQKVEQAALRAIQLDDTLAEAYVPLGLTKYNNFEWVEAEIYLKRALELDPNSSSAHTAYWGYLLGQGRLDEGFHHAMSAQELDPTNSPGAIAFPFFLARQYDKAIELYRQGVEKTPDNAHVHILLGEAFVAKGMIADGVAATQKGISLDASLAKSPERWDRYPMLAYAYAVAGRRDEALKILAEQHKLAEQRYVSPYNFAIIYTGLGDRDRAFAWLEKCIEQRTRPMWQFRSRPLFDPLRSDPRYAELLRKMNLTP